MKTDDEYSRIEAILALQGSELREVEQQLLQALDDPAEDVRKAALLVLGDKFDPAYLSLFQGACGDPSPEVRKVAAEYLLGVSDADIRHVTIKRLGEEKRPEFTPLIVQALLDSHYTIAAAAEKILISKNDYGCIGPLLQIVSDQRLHDQIRLRAMHILGTFDDDGAVNGLLALLSDQTLGSTAAIALAMSPQEQANDLLLKALNGGDRRVQLNVLSGIASNGDIRALDHLCLMLENEDPNCRFRAAHALYGIAEKRRLSHWNSDDWCLDMVSAVAPLSAAYQDHDEDVRSAAVGALGAIGSPGSLDTLVLALTDSSAHVVISAVMALGEFKGQTALAALLDMLISAQLQDDKLLHGIIVGALGRLGDQRASQHLAALLKSDAWEVRIDAAITLLELGDTRGWQLLVDSLEDEEEEQWVYCRCSIAESLANSGNSAAVDVLLDAVNRIKVLDDMDICFLETLITCLLKFKDLRIWPAVEKWRQFRFDFSVDLFQCNSNKATNRR